jgi:hypothetical protein
LPVTAGWPITCRNTCQVQDCLVGGGELIPINVFTHSTKLLTFGRFYSPFAETRKSS